MTKLLIVYRSVMLVYNDTSLKYLGIFFQCGYCLNCDINNSVRIRQQTQLLLATVDMLLSYLNYF